MNIFSASFASKKYRHLQIRLEQECHRRGMAPISFDLSWIRRQSVYPNHRDIFDNPRGAGYWAWKPLLLLELATTLPEGSLVIYLDSSILFSQNPIPFILDTRTTQLVWTGFINKEWTKRDCFVRMFCDTEEFYNITQVWAGIICMKVNKWSRGFMREWLGYCLDISIISDNPNICGLPNFPEFKDHRHDQSILTNLAHQYGTMITKTNIFEDK